MSLPIVDDGLVKGRSCGECNACCVHLDIDQPETIAHAAHVPCAKLCSGGCSIYKSRPMTCVVYRCLWLEGFGGDEHRPDRFGAIFHVNNQETMGVDIAYVLASETRPDVFADGSPGREIVKEMGFQEVVVIATFDGKRESIIPLRPKVGQG